MRACPVLDRGTDAAVRTAHPRSLAEVIQEGCPLSHNGMEGHLWRGLEDRLPTEQKANWAEYTAFSNTLQTKGFSLLEGPLEGTPDVLLILLAENAEETRSRFAADCWHRNYLLRIAQIVL